MLDSLDGLIHRFRFRQGGPDMKAVVFHGIGDIRIDTVPDPEVSAATDAV
ncbi:glutathione-dependent formaldehyde dehydrogenase, partial [Burkholderia cenocepacia]|nr:glutathione-dependent formaldehyde dehydrogenase [Burkholderia cenocepacia]